MSDPNPKAEFFFTKAGNWQEAYGKLREIALSFDLAEELKWGKPCYSSKGKGIFLIHGFKGYCALLFFKGALLKDPKGVLIQQTENVQAARQIRFKSAAEIDKLEKVVRTCIKDAIAVEKEGQEVKYKETSEFKVPEEFQQKLDASPALKFAFESLTPGRQRGYLLYFAGAKQAKTREARIEKYKPQILKGKGLDD